MTIASSRDPIASYEPGSGVDELFASDGVIRSHWNDLARAYVGLGTEELLRRRAEVELLLEQDGVTYNLTKDDHRQQAWALDPVPLIIPNDEWKGIERGVRQRAEILDLVMRDLYGGRRLLETGVIPPVMILDDPAFLRVADGITLPTPRQLAVFAADLTRSPSGRWVAMSSRSQAPSGAGYAIQNRNVVSRVFPTIFRNAEALRLAPFVRTLRATLQASAPPGVDDPSIVVLTPGPHSETAFEHAFMATQLGYPLVEGSDLVNRDGRIWLRTVSELAPVDVILRRVDAWFCDPLELLPQSTLGVPGLVDACRSGAVSVVNPLGAGVLENAGVDTLLPQLSRHLLGEHLEMPSVGSWWCGDTSARSHVVANLDAMVVRPISRRRGGGIIDASLMAASERSDLADRIEANPEQWVGQLWTEPSTAPMLTPGGLMSSPTVLRAFAVAREDGYLAMTGGLARTSASPGPITNQTGAVAKDTWVLSTEPETAGGFWLLGTGAPTAEPIAPLSSRAAENMFWLGRYSERAETTVRLIRVVSGRRTEFEHTGSGPGLEALTLLLEAVTQVTTTYPGFLGNDGPNKLADPESELFSLVVDAGRPGTIAQATDRMFDAVDVLRDQLSVDTWLVIGTMQRSLERLGRITADRDDGATTVLNGLLESLLALSGLMAESMVRDHAWQFLEAGRRLERALQITALVTALLTVEHDPATESIVAESTLMATESIITYRRRYRSHARVSTLLDLLLLDGGNPRSLRYQLDRLVETVGALDAARHEVSSSAAATLCFEASGLLQRADTSSMAAPHDGGRRPGLITFLDEIRMLLIRIGDAIGADNFTRLLPQHAVTTPSEPPGWAS